MSQGSSERETSDRKSCGLRCWLIPIGIAAVGLGLRLFRWTVDELRPDEAFLGYVSGLPWSEILPLAWEDNPPLAHFLVAISERLFGPGEAALRLPFLIGGALLPPATYLGGRTLFGRPAGIYAGLIVALSPIHCSYSQIARSYSLFPLFTLASAMALYLLLHRKRQGDILLAAVSLAATIYVHQWGVFLIPCAYLLLLLLRTPGGLKRVFLSHVIAAILCTPLIPSARPSAEHKEIVKSFYEPVWAGTPPALAVPKSLEALWAGGAYPPHTTIKLNRAARFVRTSPPESALPRLVAAVPSAAWRVVAWLTLVYLLLAGFAPFRDETLPLGELRGKRWLLAVHLAVPLLLGWIVSLLLTPVYLVGRQDVMVLPFLAIIAGVGLAKMRRATGAVFFGVYLLLAASTLIPFYQVEFSEGNRGRARLLLEVMRPGDVVVYTGYTQNPIEYYMRPEPPPAGTVTFPVSFAARRTGIPLRRLEEDPGWIWTEAGAVIRRVGELRSEEGAVYVVESAGPWMEALEPLLESHLRGADAARLGDSGITRFRPKEIK